jgi:hypothetical protein
MVWLEEIDRVGDEVWARRMRAIPGSGATGLEEIDRVGDPRFAETTRPKAVLQTSPRLAGRSRYTKVVETATFKWQSELYCGAVFAKSPAFIIVSLAGST